MRRPAPWLQCAAAVTLVVGASDLARAAEKDPRKAAIKLIGQGDHLFKKGDYAAALAKYQEAFQIFPSPKIFYAMAKAEEKLGRAVDAIAHYEQFIDEAGDEVNEDLRVDAQVSVQELEKTLAVVKLDVRPDGVTISVDGAEVGVSPAEKPLRLAPGEHRYHFEKSGWDSIDKTARLAAGDRLDEQITLREHQEAPVAVRGAALPAPTLPQRTRHERIVLWSSVGVTSALALGWLGTGAAALRDHDRYADVHRSLAERVAAREHGKAWALTSDLLLASTLAAAAFTTWWFLDSRPERPERDARLVPYVDPGGGGGLALSGAW